MGRGHDNASARADPALLDPVALANLEPDEVKNPLANRTFASDMYGVVGLVVFFTWMYHVCTQYLAWERDPTSTDKPNTSIATVGVPVFIIGMIVEYVLSKLLGREVYRLNDTVSAFHNGIFQQVFVVITKVFGAHFGVALLTAIPFEYIHTHYAVAHLTGVTGFVAMFFARDFCYYWFHRAAHRVACLWAVHAVHHMPNEFNISTNVSQGMLQRVASTLFYAPLALFFPAEIYAIIFPAEKIFGALTHTTLVHKMHPLLGLFFVTPSHHRVHHAGAPAKYIDKNYGEMLCIWDKLFGTFEPEGDEPIVFGWVHAHESWSPVEAQTVVWRQIGAKAATCAGWLDKVRCYFKPPGWNPADGSEFALVDATPWSAEKYDADVRGALKLYGSVHFTATLAAAIFIMVRYKAFFPDYTTLAVASALVYWAAANIGVLWDRKLSTARELVRLLFLVPGVSFLARETSGELAAQSVMYVATIFAAVSALVFVSAAATQRAKQKRVWVREAGRRFTKQLARQMKRE